MSIAAPTNGQPVQLRVTLHALPEVDADSGDQSSLTPDADPNV